MKFVPYPKKERRPGGPLLPLRYKEGWMEFYKKEDAINAATQMNLSPVAVRRQRKSYGRMWNVKYLPQFEWGQLAESKEEERRLRRAELLSARREEQSLNEQYRRLVLQKRKKTKRPRDQEGESTGEVREEPAEKHEKPETPDREATKPKKKATLKTQKIKNQKS
ncbi:ESF2/ABP1 family protein [Angomonas deanei]|uniref:Uncharacterized protein n=1 Tax=Angomonas deanei TaxID=59799 RepID=A0A7G2C6T0_9TRYP|nr:ESF2/ABP1 family protein [Angomonas deanei]CAD2214507.1 hypothetical protein, conserved [Angomonas deanei]|eukprot:EPY22507.1 ESF2/ABP1 family protein [Angomonas deanei]